MSMSLSQWAEESDWPAFLCRRRRTPITPGNNIQNCRGTMAGTSYSAVTVLLPSTPNFINVSEDKGDANAPKFHCPFRGSRVFRIHPLSRQLRLFSEWG